MARKACELLKFCHILKRKIHKKMPDLSVNKCRRQKKNSSRNGSVTYHRGTTMVGCGVWWCMVLACMSRVMGEWYDTFTGNQITEERLAALRLNNLIPFCAIEVKNCSLEEPRRFDYSCNNVHYPSRGMTMTPYHRLLPPDYSKDGGLRTTKAGGPLPNARALRVALVPDGRISNKKYTQLLTSMAVLVTGETTTVHDTANYIGLTLTCCMPGSELNPRCMPIRVPDDDLHLRFSPVRCMNLTRSVTYQNLGCVSTTLPLERVNLATPMIDLSVIYGNEESKMMAIRERWGGRLTAEKIKGKEWPLGNGTGCLQNIRNLNETRCHSSAELFANSLLPTNLAFLWFFRQHNYLAERLAKLNPCWSDEQLFSIAREINIAIWQQIMYYELMPNIVDYEFLVKNMVILPGHGHVDDYDPFLEPRVSLEYTILARWFHTMQEGRLNLYDNRGKIVRQLAVVEMTLHTGALPLNNTLEGLTQGSFRQPCASLDKAMDPDMGERVLGRMQLASDVMAVDIMKARDNGLPSYNRYRELCKLPVAKDFDDFYHWLPKEQAEAFELMYEDVEDVEVMAGLLAEHPMGEGAVGPTHACIIADQMLRWRRADRFWYEHSTRPDAFTPEQLHEIRKMSMARMLCDYGDNVDSVQPNPFQLPGPGNEITPCPEYLNMNLDVWRDASCTPKRHQLYN